VRFTGRSRRTSILCAKPFDRRRSCGRAGRPSTRTMQHAATASVPNTQSESPRAFEQPSALWPTLPRDCARCRD